ncbi:MAG: GAF domain-containing protein, partial [Xanthomonadaceae bacterium]|nr:GAF domain-containing protein [Xanthomonadaceae bacterium]
MPGATPDALPELQPPAAATRAPALLEWLRDLAQQRREQMLRRDRLQATVSRLEKADRLQRALYAIAEQASAQRELSAVLRTLHEIVGSLTYAENFFIALHDARSDSVRFAYYADVADREPPDPQQSYPLDGMRHSATWHLIRGGRALMGPLDAIAAAVQGPFLPNGPTCVDFLGVPLLRGQEIVGCIAVQSYREDARYLDEDRALLSYVAQHIQTALERREAQAELERRVIERTEALREANRVLQQQVLERQRGERLQAALFRIAELAGTTESLDAFYAAMHRVVGGLLYARNFYIALLSDDGEGLTFPYSVDERDPSRRPRRLGRGMTEYVLQHGTAQLAHRSDIERMHASGEIVASGATAECWLGVPLIIGERTVGVLTVQSYTPEHRYTARDQDLLTFVSYQIANALDRKRAAESLKQAN